MENTGSAKNPVSSCIAHTHSSSLDEITAA
jgi:hypothetical protein